VKELRKEEKVIGFFICNDKKMSWLREHVATRKTLDLFKCASFPSKQGSNQKIKEKG